MSSYTNTEIGICKWCFGPGPSYYGSYTSGCEAWFNCLYCGQAHEESGDHLEHCTATGGFGVLICKLTSESYPKCKIHWKAGVGQPYVVYRLGENKVVNEALLQMLKARSEWLLRIAFDRDRDKETATRRFDLVAVPRRIVQELGTPPWLHEITSELLEGWASPEDTCQTVPSQTKEGGRFNIPGEQDRQRYNCPMEFSLISTTGDVYWPLAPAPSPATGRGGSEARSARTITKV